MPIGSVAGSTNVLPLSPATPASGPVPQGKSAHSAGKRAGLQPAAAAGSTQALWSRYEGTAPLPASRGAQRGLQAAAMLGPHPETQRQNLMQMEGILRLYADNGDPALRPALTEVKQLEDAVGAAEQPSTPDETAQAQARLQALVQASWTPDAQGKIPALGRLVDAIAAQDFGSDAADAQLMKQAIRGFLKKLEHKSFDFGQLQGNSGIHELRREVRWITYFNSLADMAGPPLNIVPPDLMTAAHTANDVLSDIKDRGEEAEAQARSRAEQTGEPYDQARAEVEAQLGTEYQAATLKSEAQSAYDRFRAAYEQAKALLS